ncbi:MAG TPA: MBL fold metallo-hydrolase [Casimicrobiaceae bacterium]|nr:MBL fold metallo-hydrolase [Casimicrobiaceae bacterium]
MNASAPAALTFPHAAPPAPGTTLEVAPGVLWLRMPLPFALDHINLWLLREDAGYVLVDTGFGDAATRALWDVHAQSTLRGRPITRIVATHYHPDHVGNAAWLAARHGGLVHMTAGEFLTAHAVHADMPGYGVADYCTHFAAHGMSGDDVEALRARGNRYRGGAPELPARYHRLMPGDALALGPRRFTVVPGYGHSPEHAALYAAKPAPLLIAGDMLLPRISTNVAVGPADPDGDSLARFLASLDAFEGMPPDTLVLPSHGLPFRGAPLRVVDLRAHHALRLDELHGALAAAATPRAAVDVLPVLFRRPLDLQQRFFAMGEAIAHLNHLWHAGRIERQVDAQGRVRFNA